MELSEDAGVGALGVPVNVGDIISAFSNKPGTVGDAAVPPKSPDSFNFPAALVVASGTPDPTAAYIELSI